MKPDLGVGITPGAHGSQSPTLKNRIVRAAQSDAEPIIDDHSLKEGSTRKRPPIHNELT